MSETFKAFANEMEKIAVSESYFLAKAMNTIHKSPTARMSSQIARAMLTANRKGFHGATKALENVFQEWKHHGRHPRPASKELDKLWREGAKAKKPKPASAAPTSSPSAPKSWKQKALIGAAAISVPAAAYGVHKYNKKKLGDD